MPLSDYEGALLRLMEISTDDGGPTMRDATADGDALALTLCMHQLHYRMVFALLLLLLLLHVVGLLSETAQDEGSTCKL